MKPLGPARAHLMLMLGMAKATDANLTEALAEGVITQSDYADMATACRGCSNATGCRTLLARPAQIERPPSYCVNGETLQRLSSS